MIAVPITWDLHWLDPDEAESYPSRRALIRCSLPIYSCTVLGELDTPFKGSSKRPVGIVAISLSFLDASQRKNLKQKITLWRGIAPSHLRREGGILTTTMPKTMYI